MLRVLLASLAVVIALAQPADADSRRAAEYMALAQAAEKRSDWQVAIKNYELAYEADGQPDVLLNIATSYERLARNRDAASYLVRFAKETSDAAKRSDAETRAQALRQKPGSVSFSSQPSGAVVTIDGEELGTTPFKTSVRAGTHVAVARIGEELHERTLNIEYGEPVSIDFRPGAKPGKLTVRATVKGAEVMIDGVSMGPAPFSGPVPAGRHTVLVSAPGYQTVSRDIEVPAQGSEQITAQLTPTAASKAKPQVVSGPVSYLMGFGFGVSGETDADASPRALVELGIRSGTQRFDLVGTYGSYGGKVGAGLGAAARAFLRGGSFRPYLRAALAYGRVDDFDGDRTGALAGEAGVGLRYVGKPGRINYSLEYFIEINLQLASADTDEEMPPDMPTALVAPVSVISLSFPVTLGVALRFGGRK